ncbi:histidine kinase [Streptomyces sp. NRRL S-87]|uniref:sensor histidine kinase n=1 Tax=Streptomyces sp. NRRL S-87 TaxID=1463920 RepID=UPI002D21BBC5|nr:histidine kinase [Streptomyces sp. NRRL S-87]
MLTDTFAYRPLGPRSTDGPLTQLLPERLRRYSAWAPHAAVLGAALFTLWLAFVFGAYTMGPVGWALTGLMPAAAVATTLIRPLAAWWFSVFVSLVLAVFGNGLGWPWTPSSFVAHLTVMTVVALRTTHRAAGWMWLMTMGLGAGVSYVSNAYGTVGNTGEMTVASGIAMLVVSVIHIRREAEQEVTAQQEVTAVERDKRTLLEERTTIARELHDVVAHHMSVVAIQAEAAPYRVQNPPPELEQAFATIRENAVAALTELRRVLGVVRSADYEAPEAPQPTLAVLDTLLDNVRDAGLSVEKTVTGAVRDLPQGVELSAYRIVQEALSNALRHAPGAAASVEIGYVLGGLGLRIVNGPATGDVRPSPGAGHGLTGMQERVAMLEGEMTAGSTAEGGYEVAVFIPARQRADEDGA